MPSFRLSILVCLAVKLCAGSAVAQESPFSVRENIVYGEAHGIGLLMDVFSPEGAKNGLGIVDVISGAWQSDRGKIRDHARAQTFHILCRKGYTVFAIRPGSVSKFSAGDAGELEPGHSLGEGARRRLRRRSRPTGVDGSFRRRSSGLSGGRDGRGRQRGQELRPVSARASKRLRCSSLLPISWTTAANRSIREPAIRWVSCSADSRFRRG